MAHSQGTAAMFYLMATNPDYVHDNFNLYVGLGPTSRFNSSSEIVRSSVGLEELLNPLLVKLKAFAFWSKEDTHKLFSNACGYTTGICQFLLHYIADGNTGMINYDRFRAFFGHYPSGTSVQSMIHFA